MALDKIESQSLEEKRKKCCSFIFFRLIWFASIGLIKARILLNWKVSFTSYMASNFSSFFVVICRQFCARSWIKNCSGWVWLWKRQETRAQARSSQPKDSNQILVIIAASRFRFKLRFRVWKFALFIELVLGKNSTNNFLAKFQPKSTDLVMNKK